jgi:hypothetical protein
MAESGSGQRQAAPKNTVASRKQRLSKGGASASDRAYIQTGRRPEEGQKKPGLLRRAYNAVRNTLVGASA